jgi:predicted nuclease of predicted toxin-antitoxin system
MRSFEKLYLDDDSVNPLLVTLLRKTGHDVQVPEDRGLRGSPDAVHLRYAIQAGRLILTHNYRDFELLHELIMEALGHHPGILVVRRDNDRKRDLSPSGIVGALQNLLGKDIQIHDQVHVLNQWRR